MGQTQAKTVQDDDDDNVGEGTKRLRPDDLKLPKTIDEEPKHPSVGIMNTNLSRVLRMLADVDVVKELDEVPATQQQELVSQLLGTSKEVNEMKIKIRRLDEFLVSLGGADASTIQTTTRTATSSFLDLSGTTSSQSQSQHQQEQQQHVFVEMLPSNDTDATRARKKQRQNQRDVPPASLLTQHNNPQADQQKKVAGTKKSLSQQMESQNQSLDGPSSLLPIAPKLPLALLPSPPKKKKEKKHHHHQTLLSATTPPPPTTATTAATATVASYQFDSTVPIPKAILTKETTTTTATTTNTTRRITNIGPYSEILAKTKIGPYSKIVRSTKKFRNNNNKKRKAKRNLMD